MRVAPEYQRDASALSLLYVRTVGRQAGAALEPSLASTPASDRSSVNHTGQLPSVTSRSTCGPAWRSATRSAQSKQVARTELPATIATSFQGSAQAFQDSTRGLGIILLMAIFVIYVVLGILYESFIHPLTILSGLPSAGLGALLTLLLFGVDLNLYAFVGVIMLVGLVKKNGIMMIDFAIEAQRNAGQGAGRSDVRGVPGALPPDHDDDDGGAGRHAADRAGLGRRRRGAPAARPGRRRRPASSRRRSRSTSRQCSISTWKRSAPACAGTGRRSR